MIDLHLNFIGSLDKEDIIYLANKQNISLDDDFEKRITIDECCDSIKDYSKYYELPLSLLKRKEAIEYAMYSLIKKLALKGYMYTEIRFIPALHTSDDFNQESALKAALKGLYKALDKFNYIDANLLLCINNKFTPQQNKETVRLALDYYKDNRVVGLVVSGDDKYPLTDYLLKIIKNCKENNLNVVVDAGLNGKSKDVIIASEAGAKRIGHGIKYDLNLLDNMKIQMNQNSFEFTPSYYLYNGIVSKDKKLPLKEFMSQGLNVTISASNMTINNSDIDNEFKLLIKDLELSKEEIRTLLYNAAMASFAPIHQKVKLALEVNSCIDWYYDKITK